jgi:hypothetical protein
MAFLLHLRLSPAVYLRFVNRVRQRGPEHVSGQVAFEQAREELFQSLRGISTPVRVHSSPKPVTRRLSAPSPDGRRCFDPIYPKDQVNPLMLCNKIPIFRLQNAQHGGRNSLALPTIVLPTYCMVLFVISKCDAADRGRQGRTYSSNGRRLSTVVTHR